MNFIFKKSDKNDIPFYAKLLRNKEWLSSGGFSRPDYFETDDDIANYIKHIHKDDMKCVVKFEETNETIAFCHFSKAKDGYIEYYGGVRYDLINKGYGVYAAICIIDYYYNSHNKISLIKANVIETNSRSLRLHEAIGFQRIGEKFINHNRYSVLELKKENFYKVLLIQRILKKCS
jgi:RimJ/RimL family protein N-acetyltransferase